MMQYAWCGKGLLSQEGLAILVQSGRKIILALRFLTPVAEVYTASHVRLLNDRATAYGAGFVNGILTESGSIPSRSA